MNVFADEVRCTTVSLQCHVTTRVVLCNLATVDVRGRC